MVPKELVWKLYFEVAQSEYRSGSMVSSIVLCTATRRLPCASRSTRRRLDSQAFRPAQVQCKAALAQSVMSCPPSVRWKARAALRPHQPGDRACLTARSLPSLVLSVCWPAGRRHVRPTRSDRSAPGPRARLAAAAPEHRR
jgi:hypothetical protein